MDKPKIITIDIKKNGLQVWEDDNATYNEQTDRTGFYNMTFVYWLKNEFQLWSETAHIKVYRDDEDVQGLDLC